MSKINKNLITEIFRQKKLMGIKQILSEGKGLNLIKDLFNISDDEPSFIKIFDDAMGEVKVSNPNLIQDIETNFNLNDISFSSLKNSPIRRTINFTQNSVILENLLEELSKSLNKVIFSGKDPFYERLADKIIEESLKGLPVNKQAYDAMINLAISGERKELEEYISRVGNYFDNDIIEYIRNVKFKPNIGDEIWDAILKKFGEAWVSTVKSWDKIKNFGTYLGELTKKNSVLEGVFTMQPTSRIAKLMHLNYDKVMLKPAEIKTELDKIFNRIVDKFERGSDSEISGEQDELTAKFTQFLSKRNESHKTIYNQWMNDWKQDPRLKRLFNEKRSVDTGQIDPTNRRPIFREEPEPFYFKETFSDPKFLEIMEMFEKAKGTNIDEIKQTFSKYQGSIKLLKNLGGVLRLGYGQGFVKWVTNLSDLFQRLVGTVLFYAPLTYKELMQNKKLLGTRRWIGLGIGQKIVTSVVWAPALLGAYKTAGSAIQDMVNSKRESNAKPGEKLELVKWYLLDDDEYSSIMGANDGKNDINKLFTLLVNNIGDFGVFNTRELGTKPAAWSLAAWYYLSRPDLDFKPSTFKQQLDSVNQNSKVELDTLNNLGKQDPEIQKVIDSMNIPTYDTLNQKIDSSIQQMPKLTTKDVIY